MVDMFGIPQKKSRGRVLVIDDEADVRKSVTMALTNKIGRASCRERV